MAYHLDCGDCLEVLKEYPDDCFDSGVTDPPYGISFMGKHWDHGVPSSEVWAEVLRVVKPGGYLLAFGGTRMFHRMACAIEDAGWEIRDCIMWVYGSGFPKSLDVSKAIDKAAGAKRETVGTKLGLPGYSLTDGKAGGVAMEGNVDGSLRNGKAECDITSPATDAAKQWQGWGTALKPAWEPIIVARKPFVGTVAANVQQYGTGGLSIDGCRVGTADNLNGGGYSKNFKGSSFLKYGGKKDYQQPQGRWPANLIHDGSDEVVGLLNDAARFFYCSKASKADREEGLDSAPDKHLAMSNQAKAELRRGNTKDGSQLGINDIKVRKNNHPTVKPTDLMRYLCRLVTPPNGIVLDPFMGSGSTGKAAMLEGFEFLGIDLEAEYVAIAEARISSAAEETQE